jgi:hypothetical protein
MNFEQPAQSDDSAGDVPSGARMPWQTPRLDRLSLSLAEILTLNVVDAEGHVS